MNENIHNRTTSAFPISIGTSIALESLFQGRQEPYDKNRVIPNTINPAHYEECWINISTLIRNISGSVNRDIYFSSKHLEVFSALINELDIIESIFINEGGRVCTPIFYHNDYSSMIRGLDKKIQFRKDTTDIQKRYSFIEEQVIKLVKTKTDKVVFSNGALHPKNKGSHKHSLILTHTPYDLLSAKSFKGLDLLESHTGVLKKYNQWNSKYFPYGKESMGHLPFNKKLLFVFGDKTMIHPMPNNIRRTIYEMSIVDKWTPFTNDAKIENSIRKNIFDAMLFKLLINDL